MLKSLVLANETVPQEFRDILDSARGNHESADTYSSLIATRGACDWGAVPPPNDNARIQTSCVTGPPRRNSPIASAADSALQNLLVTTSPPYESKANKAQPLLASVSTKTPLPNNPLAEALCHEKDPRIWDVCERLEFAHRKVKLATWERSLIRERILTATGKEFPDVVGYLVRRLRDSLVEFGLPQPRVESIVAMCQSQSL